MRSGGGAFDVDLGPELEAAMAEHRAEVDAIAAGPWPPTFDDTVGALERSGERLHVAEHLLSYLASAASTPEIRALDAEMRPRLAAHRDAIELDAAVFARIDDLVARRAELGLDAAGGRARPLPPRSRSRGRDTRRDRAGAPAGDQRAPVRARDDVPGEPARGEHGARGPGRIGR